MNTGKNNEHKKVVNNEMRDAPSFTLSVALRVATFYNKNYINQCTGANHIM